MRKFGFNLSLCLNILGCILFYRHKPHFIWFSTIGSLILVLGILYPQALTPLKKILDRIIFSFSWIISLISLLFVFYIIVTPVGVLLRVFGRDLLDQRIDRKATSYWKKRKKLVSTQDIYERMG